MWNILHSTFEWIQNKVKNTALQSYINDSVYNTLLNVYVYTTEKYVYGKQYINQQYGRNKYFKWAIDSIYKVHAYFIHYKIEPIDQNIWCNEIAIYKNTLSNSNSDSKDPPYRLNEKYLFYGENEGSFDDSTITYIVYGQLSKYSVPVNVLIYFKNNDKIILRNKMNMIEYNNTTYKYIHTSYRFITVEYIYKNYIITLDLPKSLYIVDNILMTPEFVFRCLSYQKESFVFDYDYKLKLIDHNINIIELKSNQCILLEKNTYKVVLLS
jgi:hypothetical protein